MAAYAFLLSADVAPRVSHGGPPPGVIGVLLHGLRAWAQGLGTRRSNADQVVV